MRSTFLNKNGTVVWLEKGNPWYTFLILKPLAKKIYSERVGLFYLFIYRGPFTTILHFGATITPLTSQEGRLDWITTRPNCRPTGLHPSPRSVWPWRSAIRSGLLSSTNTPILCNPWSLTANIAPPPSAVTRGSRCLVLKLHYNETAIRKDSTSQPTSKQESVFWATKRTIAPPATPKSGLVC